MKPNNLIFPTLLISAAISLNAENPSINIPDDYLKNLYNYRLDHTRGMRDRNPELIPWIGNDHQAKDASGNIDIWEAPTADEIRRLKEMGIDFPEMEFYDATGTAEMRQPTHTTEHTIYALPGVPAALYPFYGLEKEHEFFETFSHWYDWHTGGRVLSSDGKDLLDFPRDRQYMQITEKDGFYGGIFMSPGTKETGTLYEVATPEQYIERVGAINQSGEKCCIVLTADLDFTGKTDVPMLGQDEARPFTGTLSGNGHTIRNLNISKEEYVVGLIRYAGDGAELCNLRIDASCQLKAKGVVGLIGQLTGGGLRVCNLSSSATVKGTDGSNEQFAAGILGRCNNAASDNHLTFENVYIGGTIGDPLSQGKNCALVGWLTTDNSHTNTILHNVVVEATLHSPEDLARAHYIRRAIFNPEPQYITESSNHHIERHANWSLIYTNCYGNAGPEDDCWTQFSNLPDMSDFGWNGTQPSYADYAGINIGAQLLDNGRRRPWSTGDRDQDRRKAGTSGVFYFTGDGKVPEAVIAADFSQTFHPETHLNISGMKVEEPIIAFRHIFHIKDAKEYADKMQTDNAAYIRSRQHKVTARERVDFQFRLDNPLPVNASGRANYFYKKTDGTYAHVPDFGIKVLDGDSRKEISNPGFSFGIPVEMRQADADGGHARDREGHAEFHTMLMLGHGEAHGHYIVQVLAKEGDSPIRAEGGRDMVLMEYDITFLGEEGAHLITQEQLYQKDADGAQKYLEAQEEYLEEEYGQPVAYIDFDQYFRLNQLPDDDPLKNKMISFGVTAYGNDLTSAAGGKDNFPLWVKNSDFDASQKRRHSYYKWPLPWSSSTYSFGYNYRYNYGTYLLATHSENVPFHAAVDNFSGNAEGDGNGLYDRLYYKTKRLREENPKIKQQQGYFYYVNAASDPGVSARLNFEIPCPGSRVIISAWVAEMTAQFDDQEAANIEFSLDAVLRSGRRVEVHDFVSGYLPKHINGDATWYHIFYSFVPQLSEFFEEHVTFSDVDHFELVMSHNGISSNGADYAIDDIRAYVVPPYVKAKPDGASCDDRDLNITITSSFDAMMGNIGEVETYGDEAGKDVRIYYAILDKQKTDANPDPKDDSHIVSALTDAAGNPIQFGEITFKSNYYKNSRITDIANPDFNTAYRHTSEEGDRRIEWRTTVRNGALKAGKQYYVVLYLPGSDDGPTEGSLHEDFKPSDVCSYHCLLTIESSLKVKIDGVVQPSLSKLQVCENQSPAIQINVMDLNDTKRVVERNAYFDWFYGSSNDFDTYCEEGEPSHLLKEALSIFRDHYPAAENVFEISEMEDEAGSGFEQLQPWMLRLIDHASSEKRNGIPLLSLHQASFVMPPVDLPEGQQAARLSCVAVPIPALYNSADALICTSPTEIGLAIGHQTPRLLHGLTALAYPDDLCDVALRIGLHQLHSTAGGESELTFRPLHLPIRLAQSTDGKSKLFKLEKSDLILVQTDDPDYRNLGTVAANGSDIEDLLLVGEISQFKAQAPEKGQPLSSDNSFTASFSKDFKFKEGYFYRVRFQFEEDLDSEVEADAGKVCSGQDVFTIKVVPQYLHWTGERNLSWDNDANWQRIASTHVLASSVPASGAHFFTDGAAGNTSKRAFAPLDFTKVIIPAPETNSDNTLSGECPWLFAPSNEQDNVEDFYTPDKTFPWTEDPSEGKAPDGQQTGEKGAPTQLIEYDMTAYLPESEEEVRCKPWLANSCSDLHFHSGATIMNQQELHYDKAWVDIELDHSRWYLASSPLQQLYAGDFYLPTDGCRQQTELFEPIYFDDNANHRFRPAVYQRSWDKGEARTFEFGKEEARNVAIRTFWSHVFNDVEEQYGNGAGFSIKTDVSEAKNTSETDRVLFRFPKADTQYWYYADDYAGENDKKGHFTNPLAKTDCHKLNNSHGTMTVATQGEGNYFLVGNPFMTHFDVAKFLQENSSVLAPKYWIVGEEGHVAVSFDASWVPTVSIEGRDEDFSTIAPMQGFFVEAINPATRLDLTYDESMMRRYDASENVLTQTTRSVFSESGLRISAFADGHQVSSAVLIPEAGGTDAAAIDQRDLDLAATVYTSKEGKALAINFADIADGTEVGVIADPGAETVLRFNGTESLGDLYLFDREEHTLLPICEGMEMRVEGSSNGRYFLTSGAEMDKICSEIRWRLESGRLIIERLGCRGSMRVRAIDTLGRIVGSTITEAASAELALQKGIFIIDIINDGNRQTLKISND